MERKIPSSTQIPKMKVMGIGSAGCNMLHYLQKKNIEHIEPLAMSMDPGLLEGKDPQTRIVLGEGLPIPGLDGDSGLAATFTEASVETIRDHLEIIDVAIILAGMGGITGTGGAPVVARIARDLGIWTIGILTLPFKFEGKMRLKMAQKGLAQFRSNADMTIVIPNTAVRSYHPPGITALDALNSSKPFVCRAAKVFLDILLSPRVPATDLIDIRSRFPIGLARMGIGMAEPEEGPKMAVRQAIDSPLLEGVSLEKARSVVCTMNLSGAETNEDIHSAFEILQKECPEADLFTHTSIDEKARTVATLIVGDFREANGGVMG